jgi:hypothetical protein
MIHRKYMLTEIVILFLIIGLALSCKSKTKSSSPYPAILSVKIIPENPRTTHDLNVIMEDVEGSNLNFKYLWSRNGDEIFGETFKTLRHLNFSKHDTISVVVTPFQGEVIGKSIESDSVVIMNTKPVISSAIIRPQPAYAKSQLEVVVEASDDDDDYIVYSYQWIRNDQEITDGTSNVLSSLSFERGDSIWCRIIPSDREVEGKAFLTEPIVITNSPPIITSTPPSEIVLEHFFTYKVVAEDSDQDKLVFSLSSSAPEGMTIDPSNGIIEWKIPKDLTGVYPIEIIVSDGYGGRCSQRFNLSIVEHTG